jgi:hypothetical protein
MFPEKLITFMELRAKQQRMVLQTFINMYITASLVVKINSQTIHVKPLHLWTGIDCILKSLEGRPFEKDVVLELYDLKGGRHLPR